LENLGVDRIILKWIFEKLEALLDASKDVVLATYSERTKRMSMFRHQNAGQNHI